MDFADGPIDATSSLTLTYRSPVLVCLAVLWALLLALEFRQPCYFLHDDNATSFLGFYLHDYRTLAETGRVAEVNYYQYAGEPFLEQGQTAVLYPPIYAAVALAKAIPGDPRWTIEWLAAIHLTAGLLGFYGWLRQGGVTHGIAALASLAWVLQPFIFLMASSWIMATYVAAWVPWLFWAMDRLIIRRSVPWAVALGAFFGFFFLQGYVQWVVYTALFLGLYVVCALFQQNKLPRGAILYHLVIAAVVFLIVALPLMLPMFHAVENSAARAKPLSLLQALFYRAEPGDIFPAQVGIFRPNFMFGMTTAILCCPALWLVPVMIAAFLRGDALLRQRLFQLLVLAVLAFILSSRWHVVLSYLPVLAHFRWPFKVFIFVDFFLLAAAAWSLASWKPAYPAVIVAALVMLWSAAVSIRCHDTNFFSVSTLPRAPSPLVPGMNPRLGRVVAFDDHTPDALTHLFLSHGYSTYYQMPSLGGYNPLVGRERLGYALGLDFPNICRGPVDDDLRARLDARAARYWIVDANSPLDSAARKMDGLEVLADDPVRTIFEDTRAAPLVCSLPTPTVPVPFRYDGNSLLIPLGGVLSPVTVSLSPSDCWWYRIDGGKWLPAPYQDGRVVVSFSPAQQLLEISFFDARYRRGLVDSLYLIVVLALLITGARWIPRR